jgi:hypothetical protein
MSDKKAEQPGWKRWHLKSRFILILLSHHALSRRLIPFHGKTLFYDLGNTP